MIKDINGLIETIVGELRKFSDGAVVGLSGGVDSTVIACLCASAFEPPNVIGVHMPYNDKDVNSFNLRSRMIAKDLSIEEILCPVGAIADAICNVINLDTPGDLSEVNKGNARSRARMNVLYGLSHHLSEKTDSRYRVIGTGNLSEDFIGYDTKGGDALCDIFPIGELFKSEVYQLAEHYNEIYKGALSEVIASTPSAGLWDGQTDEEELGFTYNDMEPAIRSMRKEIDGVVVLGTGHIKEMSPIQTFVLEMHVKNKHKHEAPKTLSIRRFCN